MYWRPISELMIVDKINVSTRLNDQGLTKAKEDKF